MKIHRSIVPAALAVSALLLCHRVLGGEEKLNLYEKETPNGTVARRQFLNDDGRMEKEIFYRKKEFHRPILEGNLSA